MRRNIIMYFVRVLVCEFTNLYEVYNLLTPVGFPRSRYIKNVITIPRNARFGNIIKKVSGCFFRCLTGPFSLVCQRILYLNTSCRFVLFFLRENVHSAFIFFMWYEKMKVLFWRRNCSTTIFFTYKACIPIVSTGIIHIFLSGKL